MRPKKPPPSFKYVQRLREMRVGGGDKNGDSRCAAAYLQPHRSASLPSPTYTPSPPSYRYIEHFMFQQIEQKRLAEELRAKRQAEAEAGRAGAAAPA